MNTNIVSYRTCGQQGHAAQLGHNLYRACVVCLQMWVIPMALLSLHSGDVVAFQEWALWGVASIAIDI